MSRLYHLVLVPLTLSMAVGIFLQSPMSVNTTLGSTVRFHCEIESGQLYWLLNGNESLTSQNPDRQAEARTHNYVRSTLIIRAIAINQNLTIHCISHPQMLARSAILQIQGIPGTVKNIQVSSILRLEHAAHISWEPPEMLTCTSCLNFVSYIVIIEDHFSGYESRQSTNETKYIFQQQGVEECTPYNITVQTVNIVGIGAMQRINFTFTGPSLEINTDENVQTTVAVTCITIENSSIVWNEIAEGFPTDKQPFLGKFTTLRQSNMSSRQYRETVYLSSAFYQSANVSLQCVEVRVCSSLDLPYTCVTSKCESNTISLPRMLLHEKSNLDVESFYENTTTTNLTMGSMLNDSKPAVAELCQCEIIVVGTTGCICLVAILMLVTTLSAIFCHHERTRKATKSQHDCKESDVQREDQMYESVLTIPRALANPDMVKTQECPAYEVTHF